MFCLSDVSKKNGSMKCLPWTISKKILIDIYEDVYKMSVEGILKKIDRVDIRKQRSKIINDLINKKYSKEIHQPESNPGLLYAFRNNCLHAGGYPELNQTRYVCIFHIYPCDRYIDYSTYSGDNLEKKSPFPINPDFINNWIFIKLKNWINIKRDYFFRNNIS